MSPKIFLFLILGYFLSISHGFKLRIAHTNDMHSRFEQINKDAGRCTDKDTTSKSCYGGFPRVATALRDARNKARADRIPFLNLNAGDNFEGSMYFTLFKWRVVTPFVNALNFDAMSLGNHEFDDGIQGLIPFLKNSTAPVVACNLALHQQPDLKSLIRPSIVLDVNNTRVGIIGFVTNETKALENVEGLDFKDDLESINKEAKRLKGVGVEIIIALGHSGYEREQKIALLAPDIDVVVGGHSHSFLYTETPPDKERPEGPYPTIVKQKSGRIVPVVQAFAYTKYIGLLDVEFDQKGDVISARGKPQLLDYTVKQDPDMLKELNRWQGQLETKTKEKIGESRVQLDGHFHSCRFKECNLGNLMTDAMVDYVARNQADKQWTNAAIAFITAGNIRSPIYPQNGIILMEDIMAAFPYQDDQCIISIDGKYLKEALEWSVYRYDKVHGYGEFAQVSGLHVLYDLKKRSGSRVVHVDVLCTQCDVPKYEPLNIDKKYNIIFNAFGATGGDNYCI